LSRYALVVCALVTLLAGCNSGSQVAPLGPMQQSAGRSGVNTPQTLSVHEDGRTVGQTASNTVALKSLNQLRGEILTVSNVTVTPSYSCNKNPKYVRFDEIFAITSGPSHSTDRERFFCVRQSVA
jgi:hypothetical protein